jgi:hypothetical protein
MAAGADAALTGRSSSSRAEPPWRWRAGRISLASRAGDRVALAQRATVWNRRCLAHRVGSSWKARHAARAVAFTSGEPGADIVRLALEQDVDLVLAGPRSALDDGAIVRISPPCSSVRPATSDFSSRGDGRRPAR